jgi:hypothetical protein
MSESALVSLFKTVDNIKNAIELGQTDMVIADSAKLVAQVSAAVAVEGFMRTYSALEGFGRTLSLWRAGKAISGEGIAKQQALAGFVAAEMVGALIDKARELNIGGWIYDLLHPKVSVADLKNYLANIDWIIGHEQGSDFYWDSSNYMYAGPYDPDAEAEVRMMVIQNTARRWTLDVRDTCNPVWQRVAEGVASPIMIDLNGDGINTTNPWLHSVNFDITGDGKQDRVAWNTGDDAFLAIDRNGNGKIDGVDELFGGLERGQGFAKLSELDGNGDGKVDNLDVRFSELLLWQDKNADGFTDAGELLNASNAGLTSISTDYKSQEVFQNGNLLGEVSTAVWRGREVDAVDVYFRYSSGASTDHTAAAGGEGRVRRATGGQGLPIGMTDGSGEAATRLIGAMSAFDAVPGAPARVADAFQGPALHVQLAAW